MKKNLQNLFLQRGLIWYNNWDVKDQSVVLSIGYSMSNNRWREEQTCLLSRKDLAEGIKNYLLIREFMLQVWLPIVTRSKMKYVDFKGREWSVEKGDWVSYQMLDKRNKKSLLDKSILKKFFYLIFLALLTYYFWLA